MKSSEELKASKDAKDKKDVNIVNDKIPVIAIVGPTASGKTELSIQIAKKFAGEIISADSMQIYKEFKICTAKPTEEQLKAVRHYMIDEISVKENFNVASYIEKARNYVKKIHGKGKIPIIVGGTGLYSDAFLGNLSLETQKSNPEIREKLLKRTIDDKGELFKELTEVDSVSAEKIHPNNLKKIVRALEFYYSFGYPISDQVKNSRKNPSPYETTFLGLNFKDRKILYGGIEQRVDEMVRKGLVQEVKNISESFVGETAKVAIGYKEILPYLEGKMGLNEAVESVKKETRAYAKRQITWFKRNKDVNWLYVDEFDSFTDLVSRACEIVEERGFYEVD